MPKVEVYVPVKDDDIIRFKLMDNPNAEEGGVQLWTVDIKGNPLSHIATLNTKGEMVLHGDMPVVTQVATVEESGKKYIKTIKD